MAAMVAAPHSAPVSVSMAGGSSLSPDITPRVSTFATTHATSSSRPLSEKDKLQRAQNLFNDSHSADMVDRQVAAVFNLCEGNRDGLLLQDLEDVHPLVTLCSERLTQGEQAEFVEPLCRLLRLCAQPFLVTGVTEDQRCAGALGLLLKAISRCLYCPSPAVQLTAASTLMPFVHVTDPDEEQKLNPVGARRARLQNEVLAESGIVGLITAVLQSLREGAPRSNMPLEEGLARLMRELSGSPQGCAMLVQSGAVPVLAGMMADDFRDEAVGAAVQVVWNVLDLCARDVWEPLVTPSLVLLLADLFGRLLADGYSNDAKELRNDVLLTAVLCARVPTCWPAFATAVDPEGSELQKCSFVNLLLAAAVWPAVGKEHPALAQGRVRQSRTLQSEAGTWEQLELMKWAFTLCTRVCTDAQCRREVLSAGLLDASMRFLEPGTEGWSEAGEQPGPSTTTRRSGQGQVPTSSVPAALAGWEPESVRELQHAVLICLTEVALACPEEFQLAGGNQAALMFLLNIAEPPIPGTTYGDVGVTAPSRDPDYINTGGGGGVAGAPGLRGAALSLLVAISRLPDFQVELGEYGAVPIMLGIIQEPVLPNEHDSPGVSVEAAQQLRQDALCVLSALCAGSEVNQRMLARERGIGSIRNLLHFDAADPDRSETLLVAALDVLWSAVDGSPRNCARFLAVDGMGALLALLESTPPVIHGQLLGCIADTCEYPEAVQELLGWRSDVTSCTAVQIFVQLWRQEEERLNIADATSGLIVNRERPLAGTGAMLEPFRAEFAAMAAAADATERRAVGAGTLGTVREQVLGELGAQDVKAKIFSVMCKCGFGGHELGEEEQLRLEVIRRYAQLKQGEVMEDIATELEEALVRPITPDSERLSSHLLGNRACIDGMIESQQQVREQLGAKQAAEESAFMDTIKTQQEAYKKGGMSLRQKVATQNSYLEQRANVKRMKQEMLRNSMKKVDVED